MATTGRKGQVSHVHLDVLSNLSQPFLQLSNTAITNATALLTGTELDEMYLRNGDGTQDLNGSLPTDGGLAPVKPQTVDNIPETYPSSSRHTLGAIIPLSFLFLFIVVIGIVGNGLVIYVVLTDRKMRQSVTNLLILNLALADTVVMFLGVPEIVQVLLDKGWLLGPVLCRLDRFLLVVSLYVSVLSLVSVCIERFIAIVFPIKAHVVCTRRKMMCVIAVIWPVSLACGLPTAIFNQLAASPSHPGQYHCVIVFPAPHPRHYLVFKLLEAVLFYFLPMVMQIALYAAVSKRLFASMEELHSRFQMRPGDPSGVPLNGAVEGRNGAWGGGGGGGTGERGSNDRAVETIRARKGVVKMLVASVAVYVVSYSPHQVQLLCEAFSGSPLPESWTFFVFVMVMTHVNSAANPVLYAIFSHNFRRHFRRCLCYFCFAKYHRNYQRPMVDSFVDSRGISRHTSGTKTAVTQV